MSIRITIPLIHHHERHVHGNRGLTQSVRGFHHCSWLYASGFSCGEDSSAGASDFIRNDCERRTHCCQADKRIWGGCDGVSLAARLHALIKESVISGCFLYEMAVGGAQISPINIWPEFFAAHCAMAFTLDVDGQRLAAWLVSIGHVCHVLSRRAAPESECFALCNGHVVEIVFQFHAGDYIHHLVLYQHRPLNIFSPSGVAQCHHGQ